MRTLRQLRSVCLVVAGAVMVACGSADDGITNPPQGPTPNFIDLESDAGDYIGGGVTYEYTQAHATITVTATGGSDLTAIDLRFEQHCEGGTTALHGAIHWEG